MSKLKNFKKRLRRFNDGVNKFIDYMVTSFVFYVIYRIVKGMFNISDEQMFIAIGVSLLGYVVLYIICFIIISVIENVKKDGN